MLAIPATNKEFETEGTATHRMRDAKIIEYWPVTDITRAAQQMGAVRVPQL